MPTNHLSSHWEWLKLNPKDLERLKYDPKDYADIFPYAEAFEAIRRKIGQDFSLRKIGEGAWASVFEIQKDGKWVYVVKLPHPEYLDSQDINIKNKVKAEIKLQKKFILEYDTWVKKQHKNYLSIVTDPTGFNLYSTLSWQKDVGAKSDVSNIETIKKQQAILKTLQFPRLLEIYQWEIPIIVMDKIPGTTLRFEIMRSVFSPFFERHFAFWTSDNLLIKSDKTLYENCKEQNISDKMISNYLHLIERDLLPKIWKKAFQKEFINPGMLESDPTIMISSFIKEFDGVREPDPTVFTQLYGDSKKWTTLELAYNFFLKHFSNHPDPNLHNLIITPDNKLWIIDFW